MRTLLGKNFALRVEEMYSAKCYDALKTFLVKNDHPLNLSTSLLLEKGVIVKLRHWPQYVRSIVVEQVRSLSEAMRDVTENGISGLSKVDIGRLHAAECAVKYCFINRQVKRYDYHFTKHLIKTGQIKIQNVWVPNPGSDDNSDWDTPADEPETQCVDNVADYDSDDSGEEVGVSEAEGSNEEDDATSVVEVPASTDLMRLTRENLRKNCSLPILIDYATLIYNCLPNHQGPEVTDERKLEFFLTLLGSNSPVKIAQKIHRGTFRTNLTFADRKK